MDTTELIESFDELVELTQVLCRSIKQDRQAIWVPLSQDELGTNLSPIEKACQHYQDFWYQNGQDGRETRSCFGLIAATDEQLNLAHAINRHKDQLKLAIQTWQKSDNKAWLELKGQLGKRHSNLRDNLKLSGLSRLHLKQTWRHIPVVDRTPSRAGFNWYGSGRSIQKMTVQQVYDALNKLDTSSKHIQTQLSLVSKLSSNTPLAKVQNLAPTMRANLFYKDGEFPERQAFNASLPILFKADKKGEFPSHNEPVLVAPTSRQRAIRSDRKIEDEAFLPSLRVHKYRSA